MMENETAKLEKPESLRRNSCRYPSWARSCSSLSSGGALIGVSFHLTEEKVTVAPMIRLHPNDVNESPPNSGSGSDL